MESLYSIDSARVQSGKMHFDLIIISFARGYDCGLANFSVKKMEMEIETWKRNSNNIHIAKACTHKSQLNWA